MSELDTSAAKESLQKALELLQEPGPGDLDDARQAAQAGVRAIPKEPGKEWSAQEEWQIKALGKRMRRVQYLTRLEPNRWQRAREQRARRRLGALAGRVHNPDVVDEAELRHWKNRWITEAVLEYARGTAGDADLKTLESRMNLVGAATYDDLQRAKRKVDERPKNAS